MIVLVGVTLGAHRGVVSRAISIVSFTATSTAMEPRPSTRRVSPDRRRVDGVMIVVDARIGAQWDERGFDQPRGTPDPERFSVSLEKISVNVEPPTIVSSCSIRRALRPDSRSREAAAIELATLARDEARRDEDRMEKARTGQRWR